MTRSRRRTQRLATSGIAGILLVGATLLAFEGAPASAWPARTSYDGGRVVNADASGDTTNVLTGVSALGSDDVWVTGNRGTGRKVHAYVKRFDGSGWATVGRLDTSAGGYATSIFALSDDDVWVTVRHNGNERPDIQHWDGVSWQRQPITVRGRSPWLDQVWASSSTDVWAVGQYQPGQTSRALILHFDGASWEQMTAPAQPNQVLYAVRGSSPTDVWAVGSHGDDDAALFLHWDGTGWRVKGRFGQPGYTFLRGVDVVSPTDAWAAGRYDNQDTGTRGLVMHWNGEHWSDSYSEALWRVPDLFGIDAVAADDVWVVGQDWNGRAHAAHWDGHHWHLVAVRNPGDQDNTLLAVSAVATDDVWAVGGYSDDTANRMTQRWDGSRWSRDLAR